MRITFLALASVSTLLISDDAKAMFSWLKDDKKNNDPTEMRTLSKSHPTRTPLSVSPGDISGSLASAKESVSVNVEQQDAAETPAATTPPRTQPIQISSATPRRGSAPAPVLMLASVPIDDSFLFPMGSIAASAPATASLLSQAFQPEDGVTRTTSAADPFFDEDEDASANSDSEEDEGHNSAGNPNTSDSVPFVAPHLLSTLNQSGDDLIVGSYPGQRLKFNPKWKK